MEFDAEKIRAALNAPKEKASKKLLSALTEELRGKEPETYTSIIKGSYTEEPWATLSKKYRRSNLLTAAALVLAVGIIAGAYILGRNGVFQFADWLNRYSLAAAIVIGMGLLGAAGIYSARCRSLLVATVLLESAKEET